MTYQANIHITLKPGVLDTQGKAITGALHSLNFNQVTDTRLGKYIEVKLDTGSEAEAKKLADEMCKALLANQVIENYRYEVVSA